MKVFAFSVAFIGATATDPTDVNLTSSYPDCNFDACASQAGKGLSGYPATCYASKACGKMDCSKGYQIEDRSFFCKFDAKDRYNKCQNACDHAADGHQDWTNYCRNGCDYWKGGCEANQASGEWKPLETIQGDVTIGIKVGTAKKHAESKTDAWSKSVTKTVEEEMEFSSKSVSTKVAKAQVAANEDAWYADVVVSRDTDFPVSDRGKQLWQWHINIHDSCSHAETTFSADYALTAGMPEKPCCVPGYGANGHKTDYQECTTEDGSFKATYCSKTAEYFTVV